MYHLLIYLFTTSCYASDYTHTVHCAFHMFQFRIFVLGSVAPGRIESGETDPRLDCFCRASPLFWFYVCVLVSAFVMVSTVWSVSCLLFFHSRCLSPVPSHL